MVCRKRLRFGSTKQGMASTCAVTLMRKSLCFGHCHLLPNPSHLFWVFGRHRWEPGCHPESSQSFQISVQNSDRIERGFSSPHSQNQPHSRCSPRNKIPQTLGPSRTWTFCHSYTLCSLFVLPSVRLGHTEDPCDTPGAHLEISRTWVSSPEDTRLLLGDTAHSYGASLSS